MKILGILLIAAGILMLVFRGFSFTQEKKVADIGPLELNKKEQKQVSWPLYAGVVGIVAGIAVLAAGSKRNNA